MDKNLEIDKNTFSSTMEYIRDRMVAIADGTGNILNVGNRNFIITCKHVAEPFFRVKRPYVVLRDNIRIPTENLKLIASTNDNIDIALIEIKGECQSRGKYLLSDLDIINDFSKYDWHLTNLVISGLSGELTLQDENRNIYHSWLTFITLPHKYKQHSENFMYAEYPTDSDLIENQTKRRVRLPTACGLSGAFILKMEKFEGKKTDIWLPKFSKVIAIQQSWDKKSYVKGSNAKHIMTLLKEINAIN